MLASDIHIAWLRCDGDCAILFFLLPSGPWCVPFDNLRLAGVRFLKCAGDIADRHNESPQRQKDEAQLSSDKEILLLDIFDDKKRNLQGLRRIIQRRIY